MILIAKTQLQPDSRITLNALRATFERTNEACNHLTSVALTNHITAQSVLHHAAYYDIKKKFDLSAQMTIRCISRVADLARQGRLRKNMFQPDDAISYDERILTWWPDKREVSLWTAHGRKTMSFACGAYQRSLLRVQRGESHLIAFEGEYYLFAQCEIDRLSPEDLLGLWQ